VDINTDLQNCGGCGMLCRGVCADGVCAGDCPAGQTACGSSCVDTQTNRLHCGTCDNTCPTGQICRAGACGVTCPMGEIACSGACVNVQNDRLNCGACGTACAAGQVCSRGACTLSCAAGTVACGGRCVDLTVDRLNCGGCGSACAPSQVCSGGACLGSCSAGQTNCGGACVDTRVDTSNCGACGVSCGAGFACVNSACQPLAGTDAAVCGSGGTMCGTSCVDLRSNNLNCGVCGRTCADDRNCVNGMCIAPCAAGQLRCGGTCIDQRYDNNNCGRCGNVCGSGLACQDSICAPDPAFRITSLGTTGCAVIDHDAITGDDRGGVAVSDTTFFVIGDNSGGRYNLGDLSGGATAPQHDGIFSDLRSGTVYVLLNASGAEVQHNGTFPFTVTQLGVLNGSTGVLTAERVTLSQSISMPNNSAIFAGYGRLLLWNGAQWFHVRLPSGVVTPLRSMSTFPTRRTCESWATWGIAEFFGGELYATYVESTTRIARIRISDGQISTVGTFSNVGDMCSITFSPRNNRWYFHHESSSQFGGTFETAGYCSGTWDAP
jgi:hypothetical protein